MSHTTPQTNAPKKRKQISRACGNCRQSKTACDEGRPCARCIARNIGHTCVDAPKKKRTKKADMIHKKNVGHSPAKKRKLSASPDSPPEPITATPLPIVDHQMPTYNGLDRPAIYLPNSHPPSSLAIPSASTGHPDSLMRMRTSPGSLSRQIHDPVVLPSLQIDPPAERPPSLESMRMLGVFEEDPMPMMRTSSMESEKLDDDSVDTSSTPFLSLKHHPPHQRGSFTRDSAPRLPPLSSATATQCELPFRTVAEPSVDLFSDGTPGPHSNRRSNIFSFSDDSLGFSGVRKTPSLEALLKSVLSEIKKGEQNSSLSDLYKHK